MESENKCCEGERGGERRGRWDIERERESTNFSMLNSQSEEEKMAMERKVQMAETVIFSSKKQQLETDELRRELEEARLAERVAKIQLKEVTSTSSLPPQSPPTNFVSMTTAGATAASATVSYINTKFYILGLAT